MKCEVELYYQACERLDEARRQRPMKERRVSMLTYAVQVRRDEAQDALAAHERSIDEQIVGLFSVFGHAQRDRFPADDEQKRA